MILTLNDLKSLCKKYQPCHCARNVALGDISCTMTSWYFLHNDLRSFKHYDFFLGEITMTTLSFLTQWLVFSRPFLAQWHFFQKYNDFFFKKFIMTFFSKINDFFFKKFIMTFFHKFNDFFFKKFKCLFFEKIYDDLFSRI